MHGLRSAFQIACTCECDLKDVFMQLPVADQCCSSCHAVRISHWYTDIQHWAKGVFCIVYGYGLVCRV